MKKASTFAAEEGGVGLIMPLYTWLSRWDERRWQTQTFNGYLSLLQASSLWRGHFVAWQVRKRTGGNWLEWSQATSQPLTSIVKVVKLPARDETNRGKGSSVNNYVSTNHYCHLACNNIILNLVYKYRATIHQHCEVYLVRNSIWWWLCASLTAITFTYMTL